MKAEASYNGTKVVITLTPENDGEKAIALLINQSTPLFTTDQPLNAQIQITDGSVACTIELDKAKR